MKPSAILESALYVTDLHAAEAFYRDIIGLEALGKVEGRHVFSAAATACCFSSTPRRRKSRRRLTRG
jgi:catechol-2,3-dioxygenase